MVPALLYLLFKKLRNQNWSRIKANLISRLYIRSNQLIFVLVVLLLLISFVIAAQKQTLNYKVIRNGKNIGWMSLNRVITDSNITIDVVSKISVSFLFTFSAISKELSRFKNGRLYYSYFHREKNGSVKADRYIRLIDNNYELEEKAGKRMLKIAPVTFDTHCMYFQEPESRKQVYSHNFQRMLDIEKKTDGGYKLSLPDGSSNIFYYRNGTCYKVKIDQSFYSAVLILK